MSERWKYQLKSGGLWGVFMIVFMTLFALKEIPFTTQLSQPNYWIRAIGYILLGIFILGYINWKSKTKRESKS